MDNAATAESRQPIPPTTLILCAAGAGTRMRSDTKKPYLELHGQPVLFHTLRRFLGVPAIDERILIVAPGDVDSVRRRWPELGNDLGVTQIIAGGAERVDSVYAGVQAIASADGSRLVAVHDAVRPFVEPAHIDSTWRRAAEIGAAILATRVTDTIKQAAPGSAAAPSIAATVPREHLWAAQTPQVARLDWLREAFARWFADGRPPVTDDASLLERIGRPVALVEGSRDNRKLTTPEDLGWAVQHANRR